MMQSLHPIEKPFLSQKIKEHVFINPKNSFKKNLDWNNHNFILKYENRDTKFEKTFLRIQRNYFLAIAAHNFSYLEPGVYNSG